ncbi:MAG: DNA polymerase III [Candidatus Omnitrophica bacterium 4484_70.1]|nr:MAG: DNA polymerase III [Candidatus Omnitrophica bacterium 4484_70.1]
MDNKKIAKIFSEIAKILELKGENPYRVRAYQKASRVLESLAEDVKILAEKNQLESIPGIGKDLAEKIKEIIKTGSLSQYEKLKKETPSGLLKMMEIPGLGPKTAKLIYEKLGIDSLERLEEAVKKGRLKRLEGIREKTEENILRGIEMFKKGRERKPLYIALEVANKFLNELKKLKEVKRIEIAGSLRRRKETVKDIDILVVSSHPSKVMKKFVNLEWVKEVIACGDTKSSIISKEADLQVDLRVVDKDSFGSALLYFTGSKEFNIKFRQIAQRRGWKINEYGVFDEKDKKIAGKTEEEIFQLMKMQYIIPEMREDRGEIELALAGKLPKVISLKDIKGDFHVHSLYSDGVSSIREIALKAKELGYEFVGICDHSQGLKVANGLSPERVEKKIEEIRRLNEELGGIKILCGSEVDILNDGSLDYPDSVLKKFDVVIAAIHYGFKQSKSQLTKRIVSACKNKYVNIIAHPTGRLFGQREEYPLDWEEIFKAAKDNNVALEINTYPNRLDLSDLNCIRAKKEGVKIALGSDAHFLDEMRFMDLGVSVARRAGLEKKDVVNAWSLEEIIRWLKK